MAGIRLKHLQHLSASFGLIDQMIYQTVCNRETQKTIKHMNTVCLIYTVKLYAFSIIQIFQSCQSNIVRCNPLISVMESSNIFDSFSLWYSHFFDAAYVFDPAPSIMYPIKVKNKVRKQYLAQYLVMRVSYYLESKIFI